MFKVFVIFVEDVPIDTDKNNTFHNKTNGPFQTV